MVDKTAKPASKEAPAKAELVGEHGPEVVVPDKPGTVVPNKDVAAAVKKAAAKKEPEPEPIRAGGHVLTEDTGWAVEEGV